jgi:fructuronate reductase
VTQRLNTDTLTALPPDILQPRYDRPGLETGIVHIGLGAFHRAHQAVYTDDVLNREAGPWGICGVSLRSPETRDALAPQDNLYAVAVRDAGGEHLRVVGSVTGTLVAPEDPEAVLARLARPSVRVVTVTVTEKGYCHEPATGALDERHPDIVHDLGRPRRPRSLPGFLVEALDRRRKAGTAPFTVLSCDNLPNNGGSWPASCGASPTCATPRLAAGSRTMSLARAAWSTASCRRPRTRTARQCRGVSPSRMPGR